MLLKDLFTLVNIRKDWRFFIHRFIIGLILTLVLFCPGKIEVSAITSAVGEQKLILCVLVLIMMLPIYMVYKISPRHRFFRKMQSEVILFCQSVAIFIRSIMILGLSSFVYSIILDDEPILALAFSVGFLLVLEIITRIQFGLKDFEYDHPERFKGIFFTEEQV